MNVTQAQVEQMKAAELVAVFNKLTGGNVKRFSDRKAAVARVLAALAKQRAQAAAPAPAAAEKPARKPGRKAAAPAAPEPEGAANPQPAPAPAAAPAKAQGAQEKPAAATARAYPPAPGGKLPRPASKRGQLLALLREPAGLTVEEICQRFGWKANDAKDALYLLAKKNGVAVACNGDGRWRAAQ